MGRNGNFVQLAGQRFGLLTVLRRNGSLRKFAAWLCRCDCGQEVTVRGDKLREGRRKSCTLNGHTWQSVQPRAPSTRFRAEHNSWESMWERCKSKKHRGYKNYGGRGIRVCKEWKSFDRFLQDMGPKPTALHTIERKDVNGNYVPDNCVWATRKEQRCNSRISVFVDYGGERMLLIELVEKLGLSRPVVYGRLKLGWSLDDAITIPIREYQKRPKKTKTIVVPRTT